MDARESAKRLAFAGFFRPVWEFGVTKYFTDDHTPYTMHGFGHSVLVCKIHGCDCRIHEYFEQHTIPSHSSDKRSYRLE